MLQYNFPTTILYGTGALNQLGKVMGNKAHKKVLIVTDSTLVKLGIVKSVTDILEENRLDYVLYDETHSNPIQEDVEKGAASFKKNKCDSLLAVGGGSPIDTAKVIKIAVSHEEPLEEFDDARGGSNKIKNLMPPLYALPTTAGTGSEVGRCGVIIMKKTGLKTIFFHPELIPDIAALEPELSFSLPPHITAATGVDAFTHSLEAYLAPGFHPMADGIALQSIKLILEFLPLAYREGKNIEARAKMLLAASMGATAFQKGLGMIHSLAHPLSAHYNMHHGLANALLGPPAIHFLEKSTLHKEQRSRMEDVQSLFQEAGLAGSTLSQSCTIFYQSIGIKLGLANHNIQKSNLEMLSGDAFQDECHKTNIIPVSEEDLYSIYKSAL